MTFTASEGWTAAALAPTVDGGEEAGAQVVVQVLILAHLKHLLPLLLRHLALDALCSLFFLSYFLSTKLEEGCMFRAGRLCSLTVWWLNQVLLTRGLVGATLQARKASL